jgi:hypothetical protein
MTGDLRVKNSNVNEGLVESETRHESSTVTGNRIVDLVRDKGPLSQSEIVELFLKSSSPESIKSVLSRAHKAKKLLREVVIEKRVQSGYIMLAASN